MAKIVSVNTGLPRSVEWHGRTVTTAIYKSPVDGRVMLRHLNLDGDRQADLGVHGGEYKAVYCYPIEHYAWWTEELAGRELPAGMFGENFTIAGLDEESVHVGDRFSIGDARVVVTQPRLPCYKLGIRFQSDALVRQFLASGRTGFYLAVEQEGTVGAGNAIARIGRDPHGVSIAHITRLYVAKTFTSDDVAAVRSVFQVAALPEQWKSHLRDRLLRSDRA